MYEQFWGLRQSPFSSAESEFPFFMGAGRGEAVARLLFLAENNRRLGLLSGGAGTGKSLILTAVENDLHRSQTTVVRANLTGLSAEELLERLVIGLGLGSRLGSFSMRSAWKLIDDELAGLAAEGRQTVFLLDHFDRASTTANNVIERLLYTQEETACLRTMILVGRRIGGEISDTLFHLSDIQIRMQRFSLEETIDYVLSLIEDAGCQVDVFDDRALEQIHLLSDGIARRINRLCDHALLAGMVEQRKLIGSDVIQSVATEFGTESSGDDRYRLLHEPLIGSTD